MDDVVRAEPLDRVVEGVQEHPTAELPVRHDVQAEIDLPLNHLADRRVLLLLQGGSVLGPLFMEHG
jgi:hypothetical protein